MATIPDSLIATWVAQWSGLGGVAPTFYNYEDLTMSPPDDEDYLIVFDYSQDENRTRFNDETANYEYIIEYVINTAEDVAATKRGDRLKELTDEAERIIHNFPITGATYQEMKRTKNISGKSRLYWRNHVSMRIHSLLVSSSTAWGTNNDIFELEVDELTVIDWIKTPLIKSADGTDTIELLAGEATFPNPVTMEDELSFATAILHAQAANFHMHPASGNADIKLVLHPLGTNTKSTFQCRNAVSPANYGALEFSIDGATGSIVFVQGGAGTPPTKLEINGYDHEAALMIGAANAAWVNCPIESFDAPPFVMDGNGLLTNTDNTDGNAFYSIPLPTNRGGLKLYVAGTRVSLADADSDDKVDTTYLFGYSSSAKATLDTDTTDKESAGLHTDTFGAAVDMSSYLAGKIRLFCVVTNANDLDIQYVLASCYYA